MTLQQHEDLVRGRLADLGERVDLDVDLAQVLEQGHRAADRRLTRRTLLGGALGLGLVASGVAVTESVRDPHETPRPAHDSAGTGQWSPYEAPIRAWSEGQPVTGITLRVEVNDELATRPGPGAALRVWLEDVHEVGREPREYASGGTPLASRFAVLSDPAFPTVRVFCIPNPMALGLHPGGVSDEQIAGMSLPLHLTEAGMTLIAVQYTSVRVAARAHAAVWATDRNTWRDQGGAVVPQITTRLDEVDFTAVHSPAADVTEVIEFTLGWSAGPVDRRRVRQRGVVYRKDGRWYDAVSCWLPAGSTAPRMEWSGAPTATTLAQQSTGQGVLVLGAASYRSDAKEARATFIHYRDAAGRPQVASLAP